MKTFWTVLISVVATAIVFGGGIYYWQLHKANASKNDLNNQISSLQSQIKDLQTKASATTSTTSTTATTSSVATVATDTLATLKTFCDGKTDSGSEVKRYFYLENTDGKFGECSISQINSGAGARLFSKLIDSQWTKLWEGNGYISKATVDQYKIPIEIAPSDMIQ